MEETPRDQIKRQIEDPDETHVGPYEKSGDCAFEIETLAWAAGWKINDEGYCEPLAEQPKMEFQRGQHVLVTLPPFEADVSYASYPDTDAVDIEPDPDAPFVLSSEGEMILIDLKYLKLVD